LNTERRERIRKLIQSKGEIKLKELESLFPEISSMTLRRDLAFLESNGYIVRTRGGAIPVTRLSATGEDVYSQRAMENVEAKSRIAKKAVNFIEKGRSLFIDSGTTMMYLAKEIPDENLSIITTGPNIGLEIIKKSRPTVTIIGGQLGRNTLSTSGIYSLSYLKGINIDTAFMATSGFSLESGFTSGNYNECELKKEIIRKARRTVMLMDVSKIDKNMPFTFAVLEDIDVLICDAKLPDRIMEAADRNGVLVY